ncbi:uncharacterized protein C11orf42 homolog [Microcaecilia unicolor]|uniref:Uncharacterized protein C11orf42 homolog n=1 Tax=Microcaecilia unicolor TaxID=1415580 RepID=A0A6P7XT95_9AMPH|nr:uncharacterized protein C11orf42 homolog [Microcaecilia unicolor]
MQPLKSSQGPPEDVVEKLFGPEVIPVPFLEDAASYDLLHVIIKQSRTAHKHLWMVKSLIPVGSLQSLVEDTQDNKLNFVHSIDHISKLSSDFQHEETRAINGFSKYIQVTIKDVNKKIVLFVLNPGDITLRHDLPWLPVKNIYVIYEVFHCSFLHLMVTEGKERKELKLNQSTPIAFSYLKFSVSSKGVLGQQKNMAKAKLPRGTLWGRKSSLTAMEEATCNPPRKCKSSEPTYKGHNPFSNHSKTFTVNWPFRSCSDPNTSVSNYSKQDKHAMSLPLLPTASSDSDTEDDTA